MNQYEALIEYADKWQTDLKHFDDEQEAVEFLDICKTTLKEKIPTAPFKADHKHNTDYCPVCSREFFEKFNRCPDCGQTLKWNDTP